MEDKIGDPLVYESPSEKLEIKNETLLERYSSNILEQPGEVDNVTRYIDIFQDSDEYESELYGLRETRNDFNYQRDSDDLYRTSARQLTFSDRVAKERLKLQSNKRSGSLRSSSARSYRYYNPLERSARFDRFIGRRIPHRIECELEMPSDQTDMAVYRDLDSCSDKIALRHSKIDSRLNAQVNYIKTVQNSIRIKKPQTETRLENKRLEEENKLLKAENEKVMKELEFTKQNLQNMESDLIIERKHNQEALKDKIQLQNKINLYSQENKSLISSQEIIQNMHKNEIDELNKRKFELSNKVAVLQKDLDYFKDNLQESHKINENLKSEITTLLETLKNDKHELQRLKNENKRLMEDNSIYKSQNSSLIEINDRLRSRSLFRSQNVNTSCDNSCKSNSSQSTIKSYVSECTIISDNRDQPYNNIQDFNFEGMLQMSVSETPEVYELTPQIESINPEQPSSDLECKDLKLAQSLKLSNPTTKWVLNRVSRQSSVDALRHLKDKIKNISDECNIPTININPTINCLHSNVTINLIQNKLELISQHLKGSNPNCFAH
ncbi:conserved hypothetical protein [Theileria equi strain WA]|uniref:Uncharacterized protein n=1 Tax=Theileria equi strain WA TaxID=1537102 RepID=L1LCY7_THEEQ|nr:conserved hypothetical protein [Theileria equi strain WA]EKX73277.1 conserved hypothetical protein [Theileria equi strain WA]|eukprot:XP_004832729.1 conserved hypothetical protein [Theileria equi strain WA]